MSREENNETVAQFEAMGSRAFFRPAGTFSAGQLVDAITAALQLARSLRLHDTFIDISGAHGFESPGRAFRCWAVQRWADVAARNLRVAVVARDEHICPDKIGLLVAAEEGLHAHICTSEVDALVWLNAHPSELTKSRIH